MGLFDIFKKKEEKTESTVKVYAPISGKKVQLERVPDQTFATKMLGDGIAIDPQASGEVVSPVNGKLVQLFRTGHAFTVETEEGVNVLVHFGMNTVDLDGKGFEKLKEEGDEVKVGEPIIRYDYEFLKENASSVITPVIVLDSEECSFVKITDVEDIKAGETEILEVGK